MSHPKGRHRRNLNFLVWVRRLRRKDRRMERWGREAPALRAYVVAKRAEEEVRHEP